MPYPGSVHASEDAIAKLTDRVLAGLDWTAKRIGPATASLNLEYQYLRDLPSSRADNPLIAAFRNAPGLSTLKCLRLVSFDRYHEAMATFSDWSLEQLTSLEALYLLAPSTHLAAGTITLQHLKHLCLIAYSNAGSCLRLAEITPNLETLSIVGKVYFDIDGSGCKRLRLLNFDGTLHHDEPLEVHSCRLSVDMTLGWSGYQELDDHFFSVQMVSALRSAVQLGLCCADYLLSEAGRGFLGGCKAVEVLTLEWEYKDDAGGLLYPDVRTFPHVLMNCMPSQGQPLWTLRTLIIRAPRPLYVAIKVPAKLPRLEELVVFTMGPLELSFEDLTATSASLTSFYAFGQPLTMTASVVSVLRMSAALAKRGLTLTVVKAPEDCSGERFKASASCIYLRPIEAEDLPVRQLHALTEKLALACRCGACFSCLRRAGAVDACVGRPPDHLLEVGTG